MDNNQDPIVDASLDGVDLGFDFGTSEGQKKGEAGFHIMQSDLSSGDPVSSVKTTVTSKVMSSGAARDLYEFMVDDDLSGTVGTTSNNNDGSSMAFSSLSARMPIVAETMATTSGEVVEVEREERLNMLPEVGAAPDVFTGLGGVSLEGLKDESIKDNLQCQTKVTITKVTTTNTFQGPAMDSYIATKEDLPYLSPAEYEAIHNRDLTNIEQARMPVEFGFSKEPNFPVQREKEDLSFEEDATKDDLPNLSPAEYWAINNRDPANIEQARMPITFDCDTETNIVGPSVATKDDLPYLGPAEYEAINNRDPANIEQARMPMEFDFEGMPDLPVQIKEVDSVGPSVATKDDLPDLSPAEYEAINNRDPANIEQARMPITFDCDTETNIVGPSVATKDDLPYLGPAEYEAINNRDPANIEQARMPMEFDFEGMPDLPVQIKKVDLVEPSVATKDDLPDLSPAEYEAINNRDPANIEQARMPMEFDFEGMPDLPVQIKEVDSVGPSVATKDDLPDLNPAEYEAINNRDPANIEQARMPITFDCDTETNIVGPSVATKDDLPYLGPAEYEAINNRDPANIEQARMPMEFDFEGMPDLPVQIKEVDSVGPSVATKDDLPDLSPAEYEAINNRDPANIEQARMPMEFDFEGMPDLPVQIKEVDSVGHSVATKDDLPDLSPAAYEAINNRDPANIEQARMPMEFDFEGMPDLPVQIKEVDSVGPSVATKDDLPDLSPAEYEAINNRDPANHEQARMPITFECDTETNIVGPSAATKDDLPYLSPAEYEAINNRDPANIEQARMPMEFFSDNDPVIKPESITFEIREVSVGPSVATKDDLPDLSPAEYEAFNNRDPANIEQARMPMDFFFDSDHITKPESITFEIREVSVGPSVATKDDLPDLSPAEYEAINNRDPANIEQARMPMEFVLEREDTAEADSEMDNIKISSIKTTDDQEDEFDFDLPPRPDPAVQQPLPIRQVDLPTKDDLPHHGPAEYEAINNRDPANIEQARMPMNIGFDKKPLNNVPTKDDLPDLSPAEYEAINNRDPANIEQARMPMDFSYEDNNTSMPTMKVNGSLPSAPDVSAERKGRAQEEAEDEWNNVQTITARFDDTDGLKPAKPDATIAADPYISFDEVFQFIQTANMDRYKSNIKTSVSRHGFGAFCHALFGPPKLHRNLHEERDIVFCAAACPFSDAEPTHFRVLKTIFRRLTGSKFDPPRHGNHWDQIGFQGTDPASDLRGTGFLSLMQLLYLVMDPKTYPLARDIYKLSHHETQNFPMAIMSINMTRLALQSLREDILNKECNKRRQVMHTLNEYYAGAYLNLYTVWKQQHKTIADSGFVIKDIEQEAKKNPKGLIRNLEANLEHRRQQVTLPEAGEKTLKFEDVCDFEEDD